MNAIQVQKEAVQRSKTQAFIRILRTFLIDRWTILKASETLAVVPSQDCGGWDVERGVRTVTKDYALRLNKIGYAVFVDCV